MKHDPLYELFKMIRRWYAAGLISMEGYQGFLDIWCELYEESRKQ